MLVIKNDQVETFGHSFAGHRVGRLSLIREIALARKTVLGVDLVTPPEEIVSIATRLCEQYGLDAPSDLRNFVITLLFRQHPQVKERHDWLRQVFSSSQSFVPPLRAHMLTVHVKRIEHDYEWERDHR